MGSAQQSEVICCGLVKMSLADVSGWCSFARPKQWVNSVGQMSLAGIKILARASGWREVLYPISPSLGPAVPPFPPRFFGVKTKPSKPAVSVTDPSGVRRIGFLDGRPSRTVAFLLPRRGKSIQPLWKAGAL